MADTTLTLGALEFSGIAIPVEIPWGSEQRLAVHQLVGGKRRIDAMGRSEKALEWSGVFDGLQASAAAQYLDGLVNGVAQQLTWAQFSYSVVVREFSGTYRAFYDMPYRIVCEVIENQTAGVTTPPAASVDEAIDSDQAQVVQLAIAINDPILGALIGAIATAIAVVDDFATAAVSVVNAVLQTVVAAQAAAVAAVNEIENELGITAVLGDVVAGVSYVENSANLIAQSLACEQLINLITMRNVLGRMAGNMVAVYASPNTITIAGGNLFAVAGDTYDDATEWTAVAKASQLDDPFIDGIQQLTIPAQQDGNNGVLIP